MRAHTPLVWDESAREFVQYYVMNELAKNDRLSPLSIEKMVDMVIEAMERAEEVTRDA